MSRSNPSSVDTTSENPLDGFTILPNHIMDNDALSLEAKMILWYLLRKTKNWEVQLPHLQKEFKLGRDGIRRVFRELDENGYATLVNLGKGADGKWIGSRWQIHVPKSKPTAPPKIKGVGILGGVNSNTGSYINTGMPNPLSPKGDVSVSREDEPSTTRGSEHFKPSKQPLGPKAQAPGREMKDSACSKEQYVPKYSPDNKLPKRSSINWPSEDWFKQWSSEYEVMEDPDDLTEILHRLIKKDGKVTNCESALRGHFAERIRCTNTNNRAKSKA